MKPTKLMSTLILKDLNISYEINDNKIFFILLNFIVILYLDFKKIFFYQDI